MITVRIVGGFAAALALAAMALLAPSELTLASTFNPQFSSPVTFSDTTPGGHPDITIPFDIPPPSALGGAVNFSDPALTTATNPGVSLVTVNVFNRTVLRAWRTSPTPCFRLPKFWFAYTCVFQSVDGLPSVASPASSLCWPLP